MEKKALRGGKTLPGKATTTLIAACFIIGLFLCRRILPPLQTEKSSTLVSERDSMTSPIDVIQQVKSTREILQSLDKTMTSLEMELAAARTGGGPAPKLRRAFAVVGINTAFSSRKRRDSLRQTWVPQGMKLKKLEEEKGIVLRFVIGRTATAGSALDKAIDEEEAETNDFLRLQHVEGYHQLSAKTRAFFSAACSLWDADFYVKVDDDVHVNLGTMAGTLARHRAKPRVYLGCMKSGPVLSQKGVKYHEPEFWKFGDQGNKYFRHATGQIYAISKDLASYISLNSHMLHKYANEDVSLGAWLIGLDVVHVDDRAMCCGTPRLRVEGPGRSVCVATFDWSCSGVCKPVDRMRLVHNTCGEGEAAVWHVPL